MGLHASTRDLKQAALCTPFDSRLPPTAAVTAAGLCCLLAAPCALALEFGNQSRAW